MRCRRLTTFAESGGTLEQKGGSWGSKGGLVPYGELDRLDELTELDGSLS